MVTNDATILRIKHEILYEVAKLAWNDQLELSLIHILCVRE